MKFYTTDTHTQMQAVLMATFQVNLGPNYKNILRITDDTTPRLSVCLYSIRARQHAVKDLKQKVRSHVYHKFSTYRYDIVSLTL